MHYTNEQLKVIAHDAGHARIIAVAGSGKTQTLTAYVQNRLSQGANPRRLLVLMYNKAAQLAFEQRLKNLVGGQAIPDIRTFHSLGYRICQTLVKQGDMPAFQKNLMQDSELEPIVWRLLRELADPSIAEDLLTRKKKWVEPALAYFELVKSSMESPEIVFDGTGLPVQCQFFVTAFYNFEQWRMDQGKLTFADLIYEPARRFKASPALAAQFGGHMAEIIVDEFQDINPVQQFLLNTLHGGRGQVMVVGDPDQTIYEFRGSKPSLLTHEFDRVFGAVTDYRLSHTFRFSDALSLLANQVIAGNYADSAERTQCISHSSTGPTRVTQLPTADSAVGALQTIQAWAASRPLSDIAVINRLWANSARIELALLAQAIPYHMDNQQTVLERYELRPFRVLLQIAAGQVAGWDERARSQAWQSLLTQPYLKIKKATVDQLIQRLADTTEHWGRSLRNAIPESLSTYQSAALFERARWIEKAERAEGAAFPVVHGWIQQTDYLAALQDNAFSAAQVEDQVATVKAFAQFVRQAKWTLRDGADQLAELVERKTPSHVDALLITSIHKAKGREWPCVIIPEVNDRFFPYQPEGELTLASSAASERRLLYVGLTRAQQELVLLTPVPESAELVSALMPAAYVEGLEAFVAHLAEPVGELALPSGMHRASVEHYGRVKGLEPVSWRVRGSQDLTAATVEHPTLGVGRVLEDSDAKLSIQFRQEKQARSFKRDIVLPLLTVLAD